MKMKMSIVVLTVFLAITSIIMSQEPISFIGKVAWSPTNELIVSSPSGLATLGSDMQLQANLLECNAPATLTDFDSSMQAEAMIDAQAQTLIGQLDALPDNAIPPGCKPDLRAIAEAIEAEAGR